MAENKFLEVVVVGYGSKDITFIDLLISGLMENGIHVIVATPRRKDLRRIEATKLTWLRAPDPGPNMIVRLFTLVGLLMTNPGFVRPAWFTRLLDCADGWRNWIDVYLRYLPFTRKRWDVIYFPWNSAAIDNIGLYESGMPVVVSCRGSQVKIRPHRKGQEEYTANLKKTLLHSNAVHCVSNDILEEALLYDMNNSTAEVIHAAVDTDYFVPATLDVGRNTLRLVTTGSMFWVKGYEYLLMSFGFLRDMGVDAELHIIGDGYERKRISFTAQDLDLASKVFIHGKLLPDKVRQQLQLADIFVFASLSEGMGNAVLEAMSCGLPVVTTDCGGVREAVTDGVEGFVVPTREPRLMAEAILTLAKDSNLRQKMGNAGRERVLKEFQLKDQVEKFIKLLSLASKSKTGFQGGD